MCDPELAVVTNYVIDQEKFELKNKVNRILSDQSIKASKFKKKLQIKDGSACSRAYIHIRNTHVRDALVFIHALLE
jgi:hypothetical protein